MNKSPLKEVHNYRDVKDRIISGLDKIANPVIQTLSPKGRNVLFENEIGMPFLTNDGVTIAKNINLDDSIENLIAQAVKQAALRTNAIAGDGTTTTILLAQTIIKEGFKLIDNGMNPITLARELEKAAGDIVNELRNMSHEVKNDDDLEYVARVSSNNDESIALDVVDMVKTAGLEGSILIENSAKEETEIVKEPGFVFGGGMAFPHLSNQKGKAEAIYNDVKVLITDKRIYYENEAMNIMNVAKEAGFNDIVIIARDFIGKAPNVFLSNHMQGRMNVLLLKDIMAGDTYADNLYDIGAYLNAKVISDKAGKLTSNLTIEDYGTAKKVVANAKQTLIISENNKVTRELRVKEIRDEINKEPPEAEKKRLERRLASLTNGIVTIKVGGKTDIEVRERMFRYEDAVNATKSAMRDGYVAGGGVTLHNAFNGLDIENNDVKKLVENVCRASLRQIAKNCNLHYDTMLSHISDNIGYNAVSEKYEDLIANGIIEPLTVVEQAVKNSFSVAGAILSSGFLITNKKDEDSGH